MTVWYSTQLTNDNASPPVRGDFNENGSAMRYKKGTYTMTGNELITEVLQMVKVPKGAIINKHLSYVEWTACGTTITCDIGDGVDPNRYADDLAFGSASATAVETFEITVAVNVDNYEYPAEDTIDITFQAATTPNATGQIDMHVFYSMNG